MNALGSWMSSCCSPHIEEKSSLMGASASHGQCSTQEWELQDSISFPSSIYIIKALKLTNVP